MNSRLEILGVLASAVQRAGIVKLDPDIVDTVMATWQDDLSEDRLVVFEDPNEATGESFIGSGLEAMIEAAIIGLLANFAYDVLRDGVELAFDHIKTLKGRDEAAQQLGPLPDEVEPILQETLVWLVESRDQVTHLLYEIDDDHSSNNSR